MSAPPGETNADQLHRDRSGLTNGTTYTFQVQAGERWREGAAESNEARATPVAGDSTAPDADKRDDHRPGAQADLRRRPWTRNSEPAPTAFTVTVNDATRAVTVVSASSTNVFLTLASAVRAGETVTVSYTVPMTSPLRDEASNPAAAFADHPVTNEVAGDGAGRADEASRRPPATSSVTLRWTASAYDGGSEVTGHQYRQKTTGEFGDWQEHPAERGARDERRQLHRIVGADQRHDLHLPGPGGERGGRERRVQRGERDPGRRRHHCAEC